MILFLPLILQVTSFAFGWRAGRPKALVSIAYPAGDEIEVRAFCRRAGRQKALVSIAYPAGDELEVRAFCRGVRGQ